MVVLSDDLIGMLVVVSLVMGHMVVLSMEVGMQMDPGS